MYIELLYYISIGVYICNILTCIYTFSNYMKLYVIKTFTFISIPYMNVESIIILKLTVIAEM